MKQKYLDLLENYTQASDNVTMLEARVKQLLGALDDRKEEVDFLYDRADKETKKEYVAKFVPF